MHDDGIPWMPKAPTPELAGNSPLLGREDYPDPVLLEVPQRRETFSRSTLEKAIEDRGAFQTKTCTSLICRLTRVRSWEQAVALFKEGWECRLKPNVINLNAVLSACEKGGMWKCAVGLLEEMRDCTLKPNVISFSAAR